MKNPNTRLALIAGLALIQSVPALADRDVFVLSWRGTAYTTNSNGVVVARPFSQKDILNKFAENTGVDPKDYVVAYIRDDEEPAEEIEIVPVNNGAIQTANVLQFMEGLSISNADGTKSRRQRFIFDEDHPQALGSMFGSERLRRDAEGKIVSFSYRGRFEFSIPEENTVYIGSFATGKRVP